MRKHLIGLIGIAGLILLWATATFVYMGGAAQPVQAQPQPYKWERMKWVGAWHGNTYATQVWCDLKLGEEIYISRDGIVTKAGVGCH